MEVLVAVVGGLVVALALVDLLITAVAAGGGAGPLAGRVTRVVWHGLLWCRRRLDRSWPLVAGGPLILVLLISMWVTLLIAGWSLVFGSSAAVLAVEDGQAVPVLGRLRYAATIVIGRGSSAVQPTGSLYEVLEPIAAMTGLTVLSLSIAYVIPVVQGVVAKRSLALSISTLGTTPAQILRQAWNGTDLGDLNLHFIALTPQVADVAQRHLAYPVIHYFHATARTTALGPSIVALDEAVTANGMLRDDVAATPTSTKPLRQAITQFLDTLHLAFVEPADVDVGPGDDRMTATKRALEDAGIPVGEDARHELSEDEVARNRLLRGYLIHDAWDDADALDMASRVPDADAEAEDGTDPGDIEGVDQEELAEDAHRTEQRARDEHDTAER